MKKIVLIAALALGTYMVSAQAPEKMSYQAIVRNASGQLLANQNVATKVSVLQGSAAGAAVYSERVTGTTNANGLLSLEIGSGTVISGTFSTINWGTNSYYLKTETDPAGGTNYTIIGTSQLLSVPYALSSKGVQANSDGGSGLQGNTATGLWWGFYEKGLYRGYIGSYAGANEDVDFGTGDTNTTGKVHITVKSEPKLTIDINGNVGIGTQTPAYKFQVDGITGSFNESGIRIQNATANTGWSFYPSSSGDMIIGKTSNLGYFSGTTGAYTSASDERLKTNFENIYPVLQSVNKLNILRYEYKNNNPNHRKDIGVTAQDLQKYFPELVNENTTNEGNPAEKNQLFVNYSGLGVVALKAIQEQQKIIDALEKRIKILEDKK